MQVTNTRTRDILLSSTSGVTRSVPVGATVDLQGEMLRMALQAGCTPTSETSAKLEPVPTPGEEISVERIQAAIQTLIDRGDQSAFTSQGKPRVRDVVVVLGAEVTREEVERAFETMKPDAA